jgi:hypothetical protein
MILVSALFVVSQPGTNPVLCAPPVPGVDAVLAGRFERVAGPETGGAAVYPDSTSTWYDQSVAVPTIDFDGRVYRMWFVGLHITDDPALPYGFAERVGHATSKDGIRWEVANEGRPVLDFGAAGNFDDAGIAHPFVLRVGDRYMMWYGGIDGRAGKDVGVGPPHVRVEQIGLATSKDGVHWARANDGKPVLEVGSPGSIDAVQATGCHVLRRGNRFTMWYGAYNGKHTLGLATSNDGIHWKKQNDGQSLSGLEGVEQLGPSVHFDGSRYVMFYNTGVKTPNGGSLWSLFAATSTDGIHWESALRHQPILGPAPPGNFGSADGKTGNNHAVHPTKMIILNDRVRIWYGAEGNEPAPGMRYAPSAIGLMEAKLAP